MNSIESGLIGRPKPSIPKIFI
ncbi:Protein CBG26946 [Caenorhabditis briggsae]|uniref:Protein CBG26946 n=1 Tax=Caenorhabditis briggsae TaxID=6238 RepID=B6IHT9_CAEBR|nr:Protein CBG26946 [Caenorhabditis briggsae]CAR99469.1 Protein CBG26946 [Caenorhabditis briggsae]